MTEEMITARGEAVAETRSIETITAEIVMIKRQAEQIALYIAIELGRRLVEAKELLAHGEWGAWLKERVGFSHESANRYMRLFREYASPQNSLFGAEVNSSTLTNLSVSKALMLLAVPAEERESFAQEHDVENLSTRQMDELMERLKAAEEGRADAEAKKDRLDIALAEAELAANTARGERDALQDRLKELEKRPAEVAVQEPDPAELKKQVDAAVKEATADLEKRKRDLEAQLKAAEDREKSLKKSADEQKRVADTTEKALRDQLASALTAEEKAALEKEIERLNKQLAMSDAAVTSFHVHFQTAQDALNKVIQALQPVEDAEIRQKLSTAAVKLLEMFMAELNKGGAA